MSVHLIDNALTLVVPCGNDDGMSEAELTGLMESYGLMEQAKDNFLAGEITFDEYLQLCEIHNFNVDSYLETVEDNLEHFRLI